MGIILPKFRKKKTTIEILEDLDAQIKETQQYAQTMERRHKKIVGTIILYGVVLCIMIAFVSYFCFFPATLYNQLFFVTLLLSFPILIFIIKKIVSWYYNCKITNNQEKLSEIVSEKKKILNEVTETETYKKAKEILLKFAPDELNMTPLSPMLTSKVSTPTETPRRPTTQAVSPLSGSSELRRRPISTHNARIGVTSPGVVTLNVRPINQSLNSPFPSNARIINPASIGFRLPLPRPVLPQERNMIDRLVDYLVGDGPSNRYALICRQCNSHNGMALKEEFEYIAFRCCYCGFWNPARKQKPFAPKLEFDSCAVTWNTSEATSNIADKEPIKLAELEMCTQSDTDSDIEVVERPGETSDTPESEPKELLNENESDKVET